jgi:hypothetical protein
MRRYSLLKVFFFFFLNPDSESVGAQALPAAFMIRLPTAAPLVIVRRPGRLTTSDLDRPGRRPGPGAAPWPAATVGFRPASVSGRTRTAAARNDSTRMPVVPVKLPLSGPGTAVGRPAGALRLPTRSPTQSQLDSLKRLYFVSSDSDS